MQVSAALHHRGGRGLTKEQVQVYRISMRLFNHYAYICSTHKMQLALQGTEGARPKFGSSKYVPTCTEGEGGSKPKITCIIQIKDNPWE